VAHSWDPASARIVSGRKHGSDSRDEFLLIDEAVPVAIHQVEEAVEGVVKQSLPLHREVGVLGDLWELAFEQVRELLRVQVTVQLDVPHEKG